MRALLTFLFFTITLSAHSHLRITHLTDINDDNRHLVTEIDLSNKGLTDFPNEILKCYNLRKLDLSNNGISGVPINLAKLKKLKSLNLSRNQGLSMADLDLVMERALFSLEKLNLSDCALTFLGSNIENLRSLREFDASKNFLTKLPHTMMRLTRLEKINVAKNKLSDLSWHISYWWNLKEIDSRDNIELDNEALLTALSFQDNLNNIKISHVESFPKQFQYLGVNDLTIENSSIGRFPRTEASSKIARITFNDCEFLQGDRLVEILNEYVQADFVSFHETDPASLESFLKLDVDSVALAGAEKLDLTPLVNSAGLKYLDLRGSTYQKESVSIFENQRPEVEVIRTEGIQNDIGIHPPIEHLAPRPVKERINSRNNNVVSLGRTRFEIPANSFVTEDNQPYDGVVELEYTEYMDMEDVVLSGIPMTVEQDGETKLMTTGGMFSIYAKDSEGGQLKMGPGKSIQADLETSSEMDGMQLWKFGKDGRWESIGSDSLITPYNIEYAKLDSALGDMMDGIDESEVKYFSDRYVPDVKWLNKEQSFEISFIKYKTAFPESNFQLTQQGMHIMNPRHGVDYLCRQKLIYNGPDAKKVYHELKDIQKYCKKKYKNLKVDKLPFPFRFMAADLYSRLGPNYVRGIKLVPDFKNDNFSLQFRFKDKTFKLGVVKPTSTLSTNAAIREPAVFYKSYSRNLKKSITVRKRNESRARPMINQFNREIRNFANRTDQARRTFLSSFQDVVQWEAGEAVSMRRRINLQSFGLFNCDGVLGFLRPLPLLLNGIDKLVNNDKRVAKRFVKRNADLVSSDRTIDVDQPYEKIVLLDKDKNTTVTFDKDEEVVIDNGAKATLVVFFTSTLIGIYNSVKDKITKRDVPLKMVDITGKSRKEVKQIILDE